MGAGISSMIHHVQCAPILKNLWLDNVKMTPYKVMGVGIQHLSCAPNIQRLAYQCAHDTST